MNSSLRRRLSRFAILLAFCILASQLLLYGFAELTNLSWPPASWPWVIRERITYYVSEPAEFAHEVRELSSLLIIGLLSMPVIMFSVWRFSKRIFGPLEDIARKASEITAGTGFGRLPLASPDSQDEISVMARACNLAFERYEETFHRLERFTRDASHQLRTPLASIRAIGEVGLSRPRSPEEYRDVIGRMLEQSERLLSTVEALLEAARRDPRAIRDRFAALDLGRLCERAARQYGEWAETKHLTLEVDCPPGRMVMGEPGLLEQAVCNLIDNAVRLTPEGGRVTVRVSAFASHAAVLVSDTGPGMAPELVEQLFKPDLQPRETPNQVNGFGLSIVAEVVRLHDGALEVKSSPGHGSEFRITLPLPPSPA